MHSCAAFWAYGGRKKVCSKSCSESGEHSMGRKCVSGAYGVCETPPAMGPIAAFPMRVRRFRRAGDQRASSEPTATEFWSLLSSPGVFGQLPPDWLRRFGSISDAEAATARRCPPSTRSHSQVGQSARFCLNLGVFRRILVLGST